MGISPEVSAENIWLGSRMGEGGVRDAKACSADKELGSRQGVLGRDSTISALIRVHQVGSGSFLVTGP